jgi:hypothetical protein
LLRVGTDGEMTFITLESHSFPLAANCASPFAYVPSEFAITNADQGVLIGWETVTSSTGFSKDESKSYHLAITSGTSVIAQTTTPTLVTPVLQAQDGTFYGSTNAGMVHINQSGSITWDVPNDAPQFATSDGGLIGASDITYDANGKANGQISELPIQSWTGNGYTIDANQIGVDQVVFSLPQYASSFAYITNGNPSAASPAPQSIFAPSPSKGPFVATVSFQKQIQYVDEQNNTKFVKVPLQGIAKSQTESVLVTLGAGDSPVTLTLSSSGGTNEATFSDGTTTMTLAANPKQQVIQIKGVSTSQKADDITLQATSDKKTTLGIQRFSVVSVTLSIVTSGKIDDDNGAKSNYLDRTQPSPGTGSENFTGLGAYATDNFFHCGFGVEFKGDVSPADYKGNVILRRTLIHSFLYDGIKGVIGEYPDPTHPPNDTTPSQGRDDNPQSGGSMHTVYDLDGPGPVNVFPAPMTRYFRGNFTEYAVLDDENNTIPVSDQFPWFARVSCGIDANNPQLIFLLDDPGDNQGGEGTTSLSQ